jgi:hypothetical protein
MKKSRKRQNSPTEKGFIHKTSFLQHKKYFPYLMHDNFEKSWAFYLHNSNKLASIIKVKECPKRISSGEDEIVVVGTDQSFYIINPFLGDGERFDKIKKKCKHHFTELMKDSHQCPTHILLASVGSVNTDVFM